MTSTSQLQKEFFAWKRTNPNGTAAQFAAWKTSGGKASPTIASHCAGLDPNNLPRTATGRIDSLELTRRHLDRREAEKKAASQAVGIKQSHKNFTQP